LQKSRIFFGGEFTSLASLNLGKRAIEIELLQNFGVIELGLSDSPLGTTGSRGGSLSQLSFLGVIGIHGIFSVLLRKACAKAMTLLTSAVQTSFN
jgi:hypothetical protein